MWNEILVGVGAVVSVFSISKWTMKKAWKKNELELRGIQKNLIELQSLDPNNHGVNEILKELDNYFLEFYGEDHFDWSWRNNKDNLKNKNI
jgi:hypothetical protein|tara:strand:- start:222 stop:494 length:273 start_codon:yes stop_codon:yes gene_type:complete